MEGVFAKFIWSFLLGCDSVRATALYCKENIVPYIAYFFYITMLPFCEISRYSLLKSKDA